MVKAVPKIPPNNTGSSTGIIRQEWYYRENPQDPLVGPMSFDHADKGARYLSQLEDRSGLAELITLLGDRPGDPVTNPPRVFVVYMYIRGKKTLGGRTAQYHSDRGLPPTV